MKKNIIYQCQECKYETTGYFGKCPNCGKWGSLLEKEITSDESKNARERINLGSKVLSEIEVKSSARISSKIGELDRVLGQGIVRDSVTILTARPGAGKSTLLLQLSNELAKDGLKVLYASGEESDTQISNRAKRLGISSDNIWILGTNSINVVEKEVEDIDPDILIIDSIQTIIDDKMTQKSGSPTQINEVSNRIVKLSKYSNKKRASFIVGQMTKQDELAGVRTLEHLVDCVLVLESSDTDQMRILYSTKNRYGNTGEVGFFEMTDKGLISIDNPSEYFVSKNDKGYGKALTVVRNGSRYIIGEIESLVSRSYFPYPQRISESVRKNSFNIIASILDEISSVKLEDKNIILKTTGGIKINEVSSDLAIAMAISSSYYKEPIPNDMVFLGEIGLTGIIKKIPNINARINEVERLGYKTLVISKSQEIEQEPKKLNLLRVNNVNEIIEILFTKNKK